MLRKQVIISSLWCRDLLVILAIPLLRYEFLITLSPMGIPVIYFFFHFVSIPSVQPCAFLVIIAVSSLSLNFLAILLISYLSIRFLPTLGTSSLFL